MRGGNQSKILQGCDAPRRARNRMGLSLVAALTVGGAAAWSLPPDPERPFIAKTCKDALLRHDEAQRGNPLISKPEMADIRDQAAAQMHRLCRDEAIDRAGADRSAPDI